MMSGLGVDDEDGCLCPERLVCCGRASSEDVEEAAALEEVVLSRDDEESLFEEVLREEGPNKMRCLRRRVVLGEVDDVSRPRCWLLLLGVGSALDAGVYAELVRRGPTEADAQIRLDSSRTFCSERRYFRKENVDRDAELRRMLNALRQERQEAHFTKGTGANRCVVAALFLSILSCEVSSFWALESLARRHAPTYFDYDLRGASAGAALVAACLREVDPAYHAYLLQNYSPDCPRCTFEDSCAFPLMASFLACAKPLRQVAKLWDLLFAFGPHFLVILVTALFIHQKHNVIHDNRTPLALLQPLALPDLDANKIANIATTTILPRVPRKLFDLVRHHTKINIPRNHILHWTTAPPLT